MNSSRVCGCSRRRAIGRLGALVGSPFAMLWARQALAAQSATPWLTARSTRQATFPKGAIIRTILADLPPDRLADGATMFHEHLTGNYSTPPLARGAAPPAGPQSDAQFIDLMVEEMRASRFDGVHCIVDSALRRRPGQNVEQMRQIAQRSGMHIILGGGYYVAPYPQEVPGMSEDQLADQFVQDATAQRWGALGEIGTSLETHPDERKVMRAISKAHTRTGLPVFTHTPHESCPKCALEQLDTYQKNGVAVSNLCIGHLSAIKLEDDPRGDTLKEVAKRGAFIGFDTVGHEMTRSHIPEAQKIKMFKMMLDAGYEDHLLLSADFAQANNIKANWGHGFSSVVMQFVPKLRFAGVKDETLHKILVDNPRRFLAFVPKSA